MTFVSNWKEILKQAWSVRLGSLAAVFAGLQGALAAMNPSLIGLTPELATAIGGVLFALSGVFAALVPVARIIDQGLAKP